MANFKHIGRLNKNRGRAFERRIAAELQWTRVPYSGGSGEWGEGDVVDGFYSRSGHWLAECKTQPGPSLSVKAKWIDKLEQAAQKARRFPVMFMRLYGETRIWVLLPVRAYDVSYRWMFYHNRDEGEFKVAQVQTLQRGKGGFCILDRYIKDVLMLRADVLKVQVYPSGTRNFGLVEPVSIWCMMQLPVFKELVRKSGWQVLDEQAKEKPEP